MECCYREEMLLSRPVREGEEEDEQVIACGREQRGVRVVDIKRSRGDSGSYASSLCSFLAARERKLVCVTSGNSYLGAHLIKELLSYGYLVRATVQNQGDLEDMKRLMSDGDAETTMMMRRVESVVVAKMGSVDALSDAFRGCHVVFHTSSFIDPRGLSGYTERTAFLETEGAKNVIEACGRAAYVKRCVFTSSLLACIWNERNAADEAAVVVDERSWSHEDYCRDNKLWLALGKTRAEKAAWTKARQLKVRLVTICPALIMPPPSSPNETSLPYLKAGRLMFSRGLLATEDVARLARAEVQLYEAMDNGSASGRYVTFDRVVVSMEAAAEVESGLKMHGLLTGMGHLEVPVRGKVSCARVERLLAQGGGRQIACRSWEVR